jgi:hypothetical protein
MVEKGTRFLDSIASPDSLSNEDVRRAQLIVASNSVGVDDCAELLDMLGLNSDIDK